MKLPWVSRERLDEEKVRTAKLEAELKEMREHLLAALTAPATMPTLGDGADLGKVQPIHGRPTIANVIAVANRDAFAASQVPGAKSVVAQMEEARAHLKVIKRTVNG